MVHYKKLLAKMTQFYRMKVNTCCHIGPKMVITRIDNVLADTPVDSRSSLLQKYSVFVEYRRKS